MRTDPPAREVRGRWGPAHRGYGAGGKALTLDVSRLGSLLPAPLSKSLYLGFLFHICKMETIKPILQGHCKNQR